MYDTAILSLGMTCFRSTSISFAYHHHGSTSTYPHLIMALNWTMLNQNGKPIPLPKEMTITTIDSGVDLSLIIPQSSGSSSSSSAAGSAGSTKRKAIGKAYLTDQRVRRYTEC